MSKEEQIKRLQEKVEYDFSNIKITNILGNKNILPFNTTIRSMSSCHSVVEYIGDHRHHGKVFKVTMEDDSIELFFSNKEEVPLKHPHMKGIVAKYFLNGDLVIDSEPHLLWENCYKVQIIGEDVDYGIVVKATPDRELLDVFILYFCKRE